MFSGYGITLDSAGSWSFNNDTARNVIIFGADNSSSSHADNFGINGGFDSPGKKFTINFSK